MSMITAEQYQLALSLMHITCISLSILLALHAIITSMSTVLYCRERKVRLKPGTFLLMMNLSLIIYWAVSSIPADDLFEIDSLLEQTLVGLIPALILSTVGFVIARTLIKRTSNASGLSDNRHFLIRLTDLIFRSSLSMTMIVSAIFATFYEPSTLFSSYAALTAAGTFWVSCAIVLTLLIGIRLFAAFICDEPSILNVSKVPLEPISPSTHTSTPVVSNQSSRVSMRQAMKNCTWALTGIFTISFFTNLLMLTGPLFMLQIYDRVLTSRSIPTLTALLTLVAGLFVFLGILELLRSRVMVRVGQRVDRQINDQVLRSVVSVSSPEENSRKRTLLQDLDSVRQFFGSSAPGAMFDLPWAPLYFLVIYLFHPVLGMLALAGAAFLLVISLYNEFATRKPVARAAQLAARSSALAESGRRNAEVLHSMGMFEAFQKRWQDVHRESVSHQLIAADVSGTMSVTSKVSRLFLQSLMLAGGAYYAVAGEISAGVIVAASIILSRALAPIEQIVGQWRNIVSVRHAYGRLSKAVDEQVGEDQRIVLPEPKSFLSTERLYAGPPGSREPVLKDLNFQVRPGDAMAVVGSNASGKSTLAKVLIGVWPALRGHVRLDGASLTQWLPQQLGKSVGYLPQDVELFDGTVAQNIARFDPEATSDLIVEAAKRAQVHDLVIRLPQGYATRVGESGISISGGQRQRIALARALFGNPSLIVLDEPNANLDNEGEFALTAAITALRESGCAVIIMAHRPNVLSAVNLVLVLKDGRQVSFGDKSKALKKNVTELVPAKRRAANV